MKLAQQNLFWTTTTTTKRNDFIRFQIPKQLYPLFISSKNVRSSQQQQQQQQNC